MWQVGFCSKRNCVSKHIILVGSLFTLHFLWKQCNCTFSGAIAPAVSLEFYVINTENSAITIIFIIRCKMIHRQENYIRKCSLLQTKVYVCHSLWKKLRITFSTPLKFYPRKQVNIWRITLKRTLSHALRFVSQESAFFVAWLKCS